METVLRLEVAMAIHSLEINPPVIPNITAPTLTLYPSHVHRPD
jgi:hypothetical protein